MPKVSVTQRLVRKVSDLTSIDEATKADLDELRRVIKSMLSDAINDAPTLKSVRGSYDIVATAFKLSFPRDEDKFVRSTAKQLNILEADVCSQLLEYAEKKEYFNKHLKVTNPVWTRYLAATNRTERVHQSKAFEHTMDSLTNGKVGLIEASTGVGKTAVMVAAANELALSRDANVVVCAPTINLIKNIADEYHASKGIEKANINIILGCNSFVSETRLLELIEHDDYVQFKSTVLDWLGRDGEPTERLKTLGRHYLSQTLLDIIPDFPVQAVLLNSVRDHDDVAHAHYMDQFTFELEPCITVCSHAMLAIDVKTRLMKESRLDEVTQIRSEMHASLEQCEDPAERSLIYQEHLLQISGAADTLELGKIPYWKYLIIDEAHTLEENFANTLSDSVSIWSIIRQIQQLAEQGALPKSTLVRAEKAWSKLLNNHEYNDTYLNENGAGTTLTDSIKDIFSPIMAAKNRGGNEQLSKLKSDASFIIKSITKTYSNLVRVSFSPVKRLPTLTIGNANNERVLTKMWRLATGAACISASLYSKRKDGDSALHYKFILSVPDKRFKEYTPIIPPWVKSSTTVFAPHHNNDSATWLRPPSQRDKLNEVQTEAANDKWISDVAKQSLEIIRTAQGGTLILMTSYKACHELAERLVKNVPYLIHADGKATLNHQQNTFEIMAVENKKPVWVAVGSAWTGLDVSGAKYNIKSGDDNLMTTLIIPKIPFGTNKTISHDMRRRNARYGSLMEVTETFMRLKQGIGRLIRREGLPDNRSIWILDSRLNDPRFGGFFYPIKEFIESYPKTTTFK